MKKTLLLLCVAAIALLAVPYSYGNLEKEKLDREEEMLCGDNIVRKSETKKEGDLTISSNRYYDKTGNPILVTHGYFEERTETKKNAAGERTVVTSYRDLDGKLVKHLREGYATERKFNSDKIFTHEFLDENNQLIVPSTHRHFAAKIEIIKNPKTEEIREVRYYGNGGKPMNGDRGASVQMNESIAQPNGGTLRRMTCYDADGKKVKIDKFVFVYEVRENSRGEPISGQFFDDKGALSETTLPGFPPFASWKIKRGLVIFGKPITDDEVILYDAHGNIVSRNIREEQLFDIIYLFSHINENTKYYIDSLF